MRALLVGLGILASVAMTGCYRAEQQRARAHEDYLKQHLGVAGQTQTRGTGAYARRAPAEVVGHAASAH